jgi:two-component system phosphate regulon sensor histidine kinase PhoR
MKKRINLFQPLLIFILAQLAWVSLVGLWIYWYVSNYQILNKISENLLPQIVSQNINVAALVWGLILLTLILVGMYFIFIFLTKQINITRLYDNFIASISHELKSPLASIQLHLETLKLREVPKIKQSEFFDLMAKDTHRLRNLINSILDISQIEQKKMSYNYQVYSSKNIFLNLLQKSKEQFKLPDNAIKIIGEPTCDLVVDIEAMKIVIDNLIDNAVKYSLGPLILTVNMVCSKKKFLLSFTDQGIGIPIKNQNKIFNKFYRLQTPDHPNIKGTGLGLYMVKEIIKSHGGKISVFSKGIHSGSTFKIELPIYLEYKKHFLKKLIKKTLTSEMG